MTVSYIGADVDSKMIDLAVEQKKLIVNRYRIPTSIPAFREVLGRISGRKYLALEEGPLAHWLYRHLKDQVTQLIVCDPVRNAYIAKDGDKDDPIDAAKLAELLRGGFLREVYHSDDDGHVLLKRWVALYHDRVRQAVREINKLRGCCRHYGLRPPGRIGRESSLTNAFLREVPDELAAQLMVLLPSLQAVRQQVVQCRRQLLRLSKPYEIVAMWQALPGVGLIRSVTLYAYLDTPWRFGSKEKLAKYCGLGLHRNSSGKDRFGNPKIGRLQLARNANRYLKDAVMGMALSAMRQRENPFTAHYERLVRDGVKPSNARHTMARKMLTVMWGMWKSNQPYDPAWV